MYLHGGFKTQTVRQLGNVLAAFNAGRISLRGLRFYFAALAAVAAREAAQRCRKRASRRSTTPRFLFRELATLCGCELRAVRRELRLLERAGLLLFTETAISFTDAVLPGSEEMTEALACGRSPARPIPLPRPLLRFLARSTRVATIKTALAYSVRGLSISRDGELKGKGTAKASWIAETCGISLRAVRAARAELIALGFITPDEGSTQWKLNRDGAYFTIVASFALQAAHGISACASAAVDPCFAPRVAGNTARFAPPYKDMKTPTGSKNQETRLREPTGAEARSRKKPDLHNLVPEDLKRLSSLEVIFQDAVGAGWLTGSEANFRNFVAAAVRATRAEGDSVRIFVTLVRRQLWHHITLEQEQRADEVISRARNRLSAQASSLLTTISTKADLSRILAHDDLSKCSDGGSNGNMDSPSQSASCTQGEQCGTQPEAAEVGYSAAAVNLR